MSGAHQQHNNIIRRSNQHATLNDARRRGRGRLAFLKPGRPNNFAAVVRPQAALPADSIAPPPSDAVQSRQWQNYRHGQTVGASNGRAESSPSELQHDSRIELPSNGHRLELDASQRQVHQLDGHDVMIAEGSSSSQSPVSPLSHTTYLSESQHAFSSIESTLERPAGAAAQSAPNLEVQAVAVTGHDADGSVGFDCPIRAGPNGCHKCTWPPRPDVLGFPSLARVREHIGSHGLLCPDCDRVFRIPTRYKDHRKNKLQTGMCSELGMDKSGYPKHLTLAPEVILAFFVRPNKSISDADAWLDGYKILHPNWQHDGALPRPFYKSNITFNDPFPASHTLPDTSEHENSQAVSAHPRTAMDHDSAGQSSQSTIVPISDSAHSTFDADRQNLDLHMSGEFNLEQLLNETAWISDMSSGLEPSDYARGNTTLTTADGTSDPMETVFEDVSAPDTNGPNLVGVGTSREQDQQLSINTNAQVQAIDGSNTSSSPKSIAMSTQSSQGGTNHYRPAAYQHADRNDSAMELCEPGSSSAAYGADQLVLNYLVRSGTIRGGKQPIRPLAPNTPARKTALKRIEKLMTQVEELYAKIQKLNSENRELNVRISEVEGEKLKLMTVLERIRYEVEMCDLDDGESDELDERIDALGHGMQNIRLLLPV